MERVARFIPDIGESVSFRHGGREYLVHPGMVVESEEIAMAAESVQENEIKRIWLNDHMDSLYLHFEEIKQIVEQG